MNVVFGVLFLICTGYFLIFAPEKFLPVLMGGTQKAAVLCFSLLCIYAVWLGFMQVLADCGLSNKLSKLLRPGVKKLFKTEDEETLKAVSLNLSANLLGISGAATPYGIRSCELFSQQAHAEYNHAMIFVISATSVQILPTTVLSLLLEYGAKNAYSILLPSFIATLFSTILGIIFVKLCYRKK